VINTRSMARRCRIKGREASIPSLQLTAQSAAALWVPSAAFGRSGGN